VELPSFEGLEVLVVDDNRTNRFFLAELLSRWGMKPVCVDTGKGALAALAEAHTSGAPFELIILDGHMPVMDGFTTAENIRQNADFSASKIVMLTSAGSRGDGDRCRRLGIQGYLLKPAKSSELFQCHRGSAGNQGGGERASRDPALAPRVMQESQDTGG